FLNGGEHGVNGLGACGLTLGSCFCNRSDKILFSHFRTPLPDRRRAPLSGLLTGVCPQLPVRLPHCLRIRPKLPYSARSGHWCNPSLPCCLKHEQGPCHACIET